ncbi:MULTISPECIES: LLM class flavin-dependent oxidoreductase [unclassified Nocardiopsis]|uniref:LLM class flavin-dependent oxidoreductase n=1 Tax=Nocardiopsis TaxID=2013 RepID=UPI00387AEF7D
MTLRIGVALEGAGWHPAAWSETSLEDPRELFGAAFWRRLGRDLERGGVDYVTVEDGIGLQSARFGVPDDRSDQVRGRLDSVVAASVLLTSTESLEVVVSRNVTHTRPFHVAAQLASLADLAPGRVTWRPQVSAAAGDAAVLGGEPTPALRPEDVYVPTRIARRLRPLFADAEDFVTVVKHLWAGWPDADLAPAAGPGPGRGFGAPPRPEPVTAGRYAAAGPLNVPVSSVPRIAVLAHHALEPYRLAAAVADRVFVTPDARTGLAEIVGTFRAVESLAPDAARTEIHTDLVVLLDRTPELAEERRRRLEGALGHEWASDTDIFVGTPQGLADHLRVWERGGEVAGVRLRPAVVPFDTDLIVGDLLPLLRSGV